MLSIAAAVMFVIGLNKRSLKKAIMVPVIMIGVSIVGSLVSLLVQNLIVTPDEINKEYALSLIHISPARCRPFLNAACIML